MTCFTAPFSENLDYLCGRIVNDEKHYSKNEPIPSPISLKEARNLAMVLEQWFRNNARVLPWRETKDPYKIWLSEIILQQTRVEQGTSYYFRFLETFPTLSDLASAEEDEILRLWQGLGYYSRARNLHKAACEIVTRYKGCFPREYSQIRALPGIGDYTAGAIASFAFGLPFPAVDGNVLRFLSRYLASEEPIDSSLGKRLCTSVAQLVINQGDPGIINQSLIEMGAVLCTPKRPHCTNCPVRNLCRVAFLPEATLLPRKNGKKLLRDRYFYFIYLSDPQENILIEKRTQPDIWKGLYQLPLVEADAPLEEEDLRQRIEVLLGYDAERGLKKHRLHALHILSHQRLHITFLKSRLSSPIPERLASSAHFLRIPLTDLEKYALPAAIFKHLPSFLRED